MSGGINMLSWCGTQLKHKDNFTFYVHLSGSPINKMHLHNLGRLSYFSSFPLFATTPCCQYFISSTTLKIATLPKKWSQILSSAYDTISLY